MRVLVAMVEVFFTVALFAGGRGEYGMQKIFRLILRWLVTNWEQPMLAAEMYRVQAMVSRKEG
ncbi:MAG: hypothetical protein ACUVTU_07315 [Desulfurispora sp.]|uniref:hypothetical protein n=1 Tax=Desulfurispora sp. TaxID=3014275 RepID=UPI00404B7210